MTNTGKEKLQNILNKKTINSNDYDISYLDTLNEKTEIKGGKNNNINDFIFNNSKFSFGKLAKLLKNNKKDIVDYKQNNNNEKIIIDNEVLVKEIYDPNKLSKQKKYVKL